MKNIFILTLLINSTLLFSQSKKDAMVNQLLEVIETKKETEGMMGGIIRQFIKKKPNVPQEIEQEIQNSLKYEAYYQKVREVYVNNYTEEELEELSSLFQQGKKEMYKAKTEKIKGLLYQIGKEFGKESVQIINDRLSKY